MRHTPVQTIHGRASTPRRIALFFLAIIVLIAAIADQSPTAGVAGAAASTIYLPLIAKSGGSDAAATATALATAAATVTATATATATPTNGQAQTSNLTGTVYLRPQFTQADPNQCVPGGGMTWLNTIDATHTITDTNERSSFGLPVDTSIYGVAYLRDTNGQTLQTAPIRGDATTGALNYTFTNVAPGTYKLEAFVGYKGDDQPTPIARIYSWILFPDLSHASSRTFVLVPGSLGGTVALAPVYLDLNGSVCPIS